MSHPVNDQILDRARDLAEEATSTPYGDALLDAIKRNNLDDIQRFSNEIENWLRMTDQVNDDVYGSEEQQERADEIRHSMLEDGEVF
jgi:uncharacterized membrane-anchored protein YjiN (DUF445 family)